MKILLATDGSEFSGAAIEACAELVKSGRPTAVRIISVYEAQVPLAGEPLVMSSGYYQKLNDLAADRTTEAAHEALAEIERVENADHIELTTKVEMGSPAAVIVDTARDWKADLVIVGSHGRGFWGRLALGSVSEAVVHGAPCSVLVVRRTAAPE